MLENIPEKSVIDFQILFIWILIEWKMVEQ